MTDDAWSEYLEAVTGLERLPAAIATRRRDSATAAKATEAQARRAADDVHRVAAGWRDLARTTVDQVAAQVRGSGLAMERPARPAPIAGDATGITREMRQCSDRIDGLLVELESARRVEQRRRAAAAQAEERAAGEAAERAAVVEHEHAAARARARSVTIAVVAVLVAVAIALVIVLTVI